MTLLFYMVQCLHMGAEGLYLEWVDDMLKQTGLLAANTCFNPPGFIFSILPQRMGRDVLIHTYGYEEGWYTQEEKDIIAQMPVYGEDGSVKKVGNTIVVKLSQ